MKHNPPDPTQHPTNRPAGLSPLGRFARFAAPLLAAVGLISPQVMADPLRLDFTTNDAGDPGTVGWTRVTHAAATAVGGITNVGGSGFTFQFPTVGVYNGDTASQSLTRSGFHNSNEFVAGKTFTLSNLPANKAVKLYACAAWNGNNNGGWIVFGDNAPTGVKAQTVGNPGTTGTIANLTYIGTAIADVSGVVTGKLYGNSSVGGGGEGQVGGFIFLPTQMITATAGANGSISPVGVTDVVGGGSQSYTITANSGYHVSDVLVDGVSAGAITSYTFNNVTTDHTIAASFAADGVSHTITATAGANGSISPSGAVTAFQGTTRVFTITPDLGYHVANVVVDGSSVGPVTSYTFPNVSAPHTITASFAIDTFAITSSAGAHGSISPNGSTSVNYGASQTYTITPDAGYTVAHVLVDGVSVGPVTSYTFENVTAAHTISAAFDNRTRLYLDFVSTANGSPFTAGWTPVVATGTTDTMVNVPDIGGSIYDFTFDHVSAYDNGVAAQSLTRSGFYTTNDLNLPHPFALAGLIPSQVVSLYACASWDGNAAGAYVVYGNSGAAGVKAQTVGNPGTSPTLDNLTLIGTATADLNGKVAGVMYGRNANFSGQGQLGGFVFAIEAPPSFTITASAGSNGSISPTGAVSVAGGANQTFTITPNSGYHVSDVLVDGVSVGAVGSYTFNTVVANHTIAASFAVNTVSYTLTASAGPNGSISPSGAVNAFQGTTQVFAISVNTGYHIADVLVDGVSVGPVSSYTFTNVQASHTIAASFAIDTSVINATAGTGGTISPSGAVSVNYGAGQTFTFTPNSGYQVDDVIVDGASVGAMPAYTFENVTAGHTISVVFDTRTNVKLDFTGNPAEIAVGWTPVVANINADTPVASVENINGGTYGFNVAHVATWDNASLPPLTRSGFYTSGNNTNDHTFNLTGLNPGQTVTMYACAGWDGNGRGGYIVFGDSGPAGVKAQTVGDPGLAPSLANLTLIGTAVADIGGTVSGALHGADGVNTASEGQFGGVVFAITAGGTPPTPYSVWATSQYGLTGNDAQPLADADKDGIANVLEYALGGTSPIDAASRGLIFSRTATVGGSPNVLTLTVAVRDGASFNPSGNRMTAVVDGLTYTVEGSNTMADWGTPVVTEVTGTDAINIQAPLITPDTGWSYRTFRTDDNVAADSRDFIRVSVAQ